MRSQDFMLRPRLRAGALMSAATLLLLVTACSGSNDKPSPTDTGLQDHAASAEQTIQRDTATDAHDGFTWPETGADGSGTDILQPDLGPTTKCSGWPNWKDSCMQKGMMGCQAICADSGKIRKIVCEEDGTCTCQVGTQKTTCATVTPSNTFCQTCLTSFTAGCCLP